MKYIIQQFTFRHIHFFIYLSISLFFQCKEYTDYNYDVEEQNKTAFIHGKITNIFTNEPVYKAKIKVGFDSTYSDYLGDYFLQYIMKPDDERDKPVTIKISADNYLPYQGSLIIYPDNSYNAKLQYAAPIILNSALVDYFANDSLYICQALVFDYQTAADIASVKATFGYHRFILNIPIFDTIPLEYSHSISDSSAYYQVLYNPIHHLSAGDDSITFSNLCTIYAYDKLDHEDSKIEFLTRERDSLLFPISY